ncbi:protein of unknown function [Methylocella tundrae]|uniref:Uncharacterized protein n=1 Tax=Methylocella tundrae TaxID=227605 RepID=A0A4U8Z4V7_METTU|nr:protein of unknown function [Methylocella tundrae]
MPSAAVGYERQRPCSALDYASNGRPAGTKGVAAGSRTDTEMTDDDRATIATVDLLANPLSANDFDPDG